MVEFAGEMEKQREDDVSRRGKILREAIDRAERAEAEATRLRTIATSYEEQLRMGAAACDSPYAKVGTVLVALMQQVEAIATHHHTRDFSVSVECAGELDAIGAEDLVHYVSVVRINHRTIARSDSASREIGQAIGRAKNALDRVEKDYVGEVYLNGPQFVLLGELVKWEQENPGIKMLVTGGRRIDVAKALLDKGFITRWGVGDYEWHVELTSRAQLFLAGK